MNATLVFVPYAELPQSADRQREGFAAQDIHLPLERANIARILLTDRYPLNRKMSAVNTECDMIVVIEKGSVVFRQCGAEITLSEGDVAFVWKKMPYSWTPVGESVRQLVTSFPAWTLEQHAEV